ncbi:MAG: hypothetical protein P5702_03560 [Limnospira sp. PMC 1291.21]|nr:MULTISPECIES: hypothetical protein [Limnospira]MDC0837340.1 hypothetical protein [Limnoraphis robusta]MDY7052111.1 hypothetical protein [Limnospira fusiformis LS22]MDT9176461.1 hypothetical protein [Limnospira sp. PMC 1238.20]MDT9189611.1 hypothetical protein [Limnospira sp. PMC 894.15]MDT9191823.1 hypothetical protein [Limnospira sp. PMC 1245.20]
MLINFPYCYFKLSFPGCGKINRKSSLVNEADREIGLVFTAIAVCT